MRCLGISVLLLVGASACRDDSTGSAENSIVLEVEFDQRSHRVGNLIGWNIGAGSRYSPESGARHPEWRTEETADALRRLESIRAANGDRPVVRFSGLNRPNLEITRLFAEHLWHHVATITATNLPTGRQELGSSGYDYDVVRSVAFVSDDDRSGSVILLNRDLEQARSVELVVRDGDVVRRVQGVAPQNLWIDTLDVEGTIESFPFEQNGTRVQVTLPPHSLMAVAIERDTGPANGE